ncbi:MAG: hypothetical protein GDA40_02350 [Rhodobacteraceae bacterium]|nr:hypothetical protein [Paracoccaceae bacterium]
MVTKDTINTTINVDGTKRGYSLQKLSGDAFCFFSLISYVDFGLNDLDAQPWPALFSTLYIIFLICSSSLRIPLFLVYALVLFFLGTAFSLLDTDEPFSHIAIRYLGGNYIFFTAFICFYSYIKSYGFPIKIFLYASFMWFAAGLLQILFSRDILSFLISARGTDTLHVIRGAASLSQEPSHYARFLIIHTWIVIAAAGYKIRGVVLIIAIINILSIFVLCRAGYGIFASLAALAISSLYIAFSFKYSLKILCFSAAIFIALLLGYFVIFQTKLIEDNRITVIIFDFREKGVIQTLYDDISISNRLQDILYSQVLAFRNSYVPHGLDKYSDLAAGMSNEYSAYFKKPVLGAGNLEKEWNKMQTWLGRQVFIMGIFGVGFSMIILWSSYYGTLKSALKTFYLFLLMVGPLSVASPYFPMLIAVLFLYKQNYMASQKKNFSLNPMETSPPNSR